MKTSKTTKSGLLLEMAKQHKQVSSKGIVRLAMQTYPRVFTDFENTRKILQRVRKTAGLDSPYASKAGKNFYDSLPEPLTYSKCPQFVDLKGRRVLVLSDIHCPFHDKEAVFQALDYGLTRNADCVLLNGDFLDFIGISTFSKDGEVCPVADEIKMARALLSAIRGMFPEASIYYKMGNHEDRFNRYMCARAPELLGVENFKIDQILGLKDLGIELVESRSLCRAGNLTIMHGHEVRSGFCVPVNPARTIYLKTKSTVLIGHYHQSAKHSERHLSGENISCWSMGCLCDLRPEYAPVNNWNHGFAFVDVDTDGTFSVSNKEIVCGKIV